MPDYTRSFIETQFPVSRISKESYKERKAGASQTLTGLGKWWGRKPLILVRSALLGVLLPVSDDPNKDREIFLKLLTMDEEGLYLRKEKPISIKDVADLLNPKEQERYLQETDKGKINYKKDISKDEKDYIQKLAFNRLSYDDKLKYCIRPEHVDSLPEKDWQVINTHLETDAHSLPQLIQQLGEKRYGHRPRVGDCFAGGGSVPFEAARMGADVYASDLNPVAALLTWASLNIAGASDEQVHELKQFQETVYNQVDEQITQWGIEHNEKGERADAYLYCSETICPECGWKVPLAPSWIIGKKTKTVALLRDNHQDGFDIDIVMGASKEQESQADANITVSNNNLHCPHCGKQTPITVLRGDWKDAQGKTVYGLRKWEKDEFMPRETDVFGERLYAIRYVGEKGRYYTAPSERDLANERKVVDLLQERFDDWQKKGFIPSAKIEPGEKTDEPIRTRGWQYWHQLFNPRQLLVLGMFLMNYNQYKFDKLHKCTSLLSINKLNDWNSKLCRYDSAREDTGKQTFYNQAFNVLNNYLTRGVITTNYKISLNTTIVPDEKKQCESLDAREISNLNDIWITDPPYADAVNYHELTEFFLAWDKQLLQEAFPEWYTDSKRILAVKGVGKSFNDSMIEIYKNLTRHMPDNGTQVVMFTHQDVKVWSELAMILWSSGLRVVSAWNIATETESGGLKSGNYVKGTVLLTLKKQISSKKVYRDELYDEIKNEVEHMIDSMRDIEDKDDPDFTDADYLLAAYAASLKVLTTYQDIHGINVDYWLAQPRDSQELNPVEELIQKAVKIAYDYLIPNGFDRLYWQDLSSEERFFIRALELEMNNVTKMSAYQELARGFGVRDYTDMFAEFKANACRLKTPEELKMKMLGNGGFSSSIIRHLMVAVYESIKAENTQPGREYLRSTYRENNRYWFTKPLMIEILDFISRTRHMEKMEKWHKSGYYAMLLRESLKNDGV